MKPTYAELESALSQTQALLKKALEEIDRLVNKELRTS
jgi:hypothetical protein